jgi:SAM-dependent methyltransferase
LIEFCGLTKGASVLDVGCGQGFFSYLFSKNGMRVHGIDMSETGIHAAQLLYGHLGITFAVANIETATFPEQFDCVFVRSCTLYNTPAFSQQNETTNILLRHLKLQGKFIFAYNTNFSAKVCRTWRYHSLDEVRKHFSGYSNAQVFFLNKITTYLLRAYSFTPFVEQFNVLLSKASGLGGDVICILRKDSDPIEPDGES